MTESSAENANQESKAQGEEPPFDAVDLMLEGNLQAQINYSMVKAVAKAFDEKAQILIAAEANYQPVEDESFVEMAMPEIEAMANAVLEGCVDFSRLRFWEVCETAEVAWEESKDEKGEVLQRMPYAKSLEKPAAGNRLLANVEQVVEWLEAVHQAHEKNGMGWVSPYGCPEDGQQAFEARSQSIKKLRGIIEGIGSNFDF